MRRFGERIGVSRRYRIPYLRCLAVLAGSRGNLEEATGYLEETCVLVKDIGLPGELWEVQVALAELHRARGDEHAARHHRAQADEIVKSIALGLIEDNLRTSFLAAIPARPK